MQDCKRYYQFVLFIVPPGEPILKVFYLGVLFGLANGGIVDSGYGPEVSGVRDP